MCQVLRDAERVIILDDDAGDRRLLDEAVAVLGYVVTAVGPPDAFEGKFVRRSATRLETSFDSLPSGEMARAIELSRRAAKSSMPLLFEGEADVGKVGADLIRLAFGRYRGRMTEIARRLGTASCRRCISRQEPRDEAFRLQECHTSRRKRRNQCLYCVAGMAKTGGRH